MANTQTAFLEELADILEVEAADVTPELMLTEDNWDSMAVVGTIAAIDEHFNCTVDGEALRGCQSVGALLALIKSRTDA